MQEVPVFEFSHKAPIYADAGEGPGSGPTTAPNYTLHGVWKLENHVLCWQVHDDAVALWTISLAEFRGFTQPCTPQLRIRFKGAIQPKPCLVERKAAGAGSYALFVCTSRGLIKKIPFTILDDGQIDIMSQSMQGVQLTNSQRVTGCHFLPQPSGTLWAFIGASSWEQREGPYSMSEIRILTLTQRDTLQYEEHPPIKCSGLQLWMGQKGKKISGFTVIQDPQGGSKHLIITMQEGEAVVHRLHNNAVSEISRFKVGNHGDTTFGSDIAHVTTGTDIFVAFIKLSHNRRPNQVLVYRMSASDPAPAGSFVACRNAPLDQATKAALRMTSSGVYTAWQGETLQSYSTPAVFAPLLPERAPAFAITCIQLNKIAKQYVPVTFEWSVVDVLGTRQQRLAQRDGGIDMGLCVVDGTWLDGRDVCCLVRSKGFSVLRQASAIETYPLMDIAVVGPAPPTPMHHPFVSLCEMKGHFSCEDPSLQDPALRWLQQSSTVVEVAMAMIEEALPKLLSCRPEQLPAALASIQDSLHLSYIRDKSVELDCAQPDGLLRAARALMNRAEAGIMNDSDTHPIATLGTAQQMAFIMVMLSLYAVSLVSVAASVAGKEEAEEAIEARHKYLATLRTYAHALAILNSTGLNAMPFARVVEPFTPSRLLFTAVETARVITNVDPNSSPSLLLSQLLTAPVPLTKVLQLFLSVVHQPDASTPPRVKALFIAHCSITAQTLHNYLPNPAGELSKVIELLRVATPTEQRQFVTSVLQLLSSDSGCTQWVEVLLDLGADICVVYPFITAKLLLHIGDEIQSTSGDRDFATLGAAIRSSAMAFLQQPEEVLPGIPLWTPAEWRQYSYFNTLMLDNAIDRCSRHHLTDMPAEVLTQRATMWDEPIRMILGDPDPRNVDKNMSTLLDAILGSGSLAVQRLIQAQLAPRLVSPISVTVEALRETPKGSELVITLPTVHACPGNTAYAEARKKERPVVVAVVSDGVGLNVLATYDSGASQVLATGAAVPTKHTMNKFKVAVSPVCSAHADVRDVLLVVSYAGLIPRVLRASVTSEGRLERSATASQHPTSIVARQLWCKGNDKPVHELVAKQATPQYYDVLTQFLLHRSEFRVAARVTYRLAERVRAAPRASLVDLESACRALALAKATLLVSPSTEFSLTDDDPSLGIGQHTHDNADIHLLGEESKKNTVVTIKDLDNRRQSLQAEIALLRQNEARSPGAAAITPLGLQQSSWGEVLQMLIQRRLLVQAANFASIWKLSLDPVFHAAASACVSLERDGSAPDRVKAKLWQQLVQLLTRYSTEEIQYSYHAVAMRTILAEGMSPPSRVAEVLHTKRPDVAVREYLAAASSLPTLALQHQMLVTAASLSASFLRWKRGGCTGHEFEQGALIPVTLLDSLAAALRMVDTSSAKGDSALLIDWHKKAFLKMWDPLDTTAPLASTASASAPLRQATPPPASPPPSRPGFFSGVQATMPLRT